MVPQVPQRTVVPICLHLGLSQPQTQTVATRFIKASHHSPHVVQLVFPPRNATLVPHPLLVIPEHIRRRVSWYGGRQEAQKGDQLPVGEFDQQVCKVRRNFWNISKKGKGVIFRKFRRFGRARILTSVWKRYLHCDNCYNDQLFSPFATNIGQNLIIKLCSNWTS